MGDYRNKNDTRPSLGQRVQAPDRLRRDRDWSAGRENRTWKEWGSCSLRRPKPVEGIFIGWRTYCDGVYDYSDGYFEGKERFEVWLIVPDIKSKPVAVFPATCRTVANANQ